jgi:hypothetical protein
MIVLMTATQSACGIKVERGMAFRLDVAGQAYSSARSIACAPIRGVDGEGRLADAPHVHHAGRAQ